MSTEPTPNDFPNPPPALWTDVERVLISEAEILRRLDELAEEITRDYSGLDVTMLAILNGSFVFFADLQRRIPLPLQIDCLSVASYHGTQSSGRLTFRQHPLPDLRGRHVLILDDILDSGLTLQEVRRAIAEQPGVLSVKTCVLLDKKVPRAEFLHADYTGFPIGNEFVVGYGLDYNERYRNLPFIGVLRPEAIAHHG
jgi:hypoxanthine phosphoribosyltransferase